MQEKALDKIQHLFMIKNSEQSEYGETYINIEKAISEKSTANIFLPMVKARALSLTEQTRMPSLTSIIQHNVEIHSYSNQARKIFNANRKCRKRKLSL